MTLVIIQYLNHNIDIVFISLIAKCVRNLQNVVKTLIQRQWYSCDYSGRYR